MTDTPHSASDNKAVVRRIPEEIMTEGNDAAIEEVFATDFVEHNPALGDVSGPDGFRDRVYEPLHNGFSDLEVSIDELIGEGDRIVLRATIRGTHDGQFNDIEPTGNTIDVPVMVVHHLDDGMVVERWVVFDSLGMLQQLDAIAEEPLAIP